MGFLRFILIALAVIGALLAALIVFRAPLAEVVIERVLSPRVGGEVDVDITRLSTDGVALDKVTVKPATGPASTLSKIQVEYRLGTLLREGAVDAVSIGGGQATVSIDENGAVAVAGVPIPRSGAKENTAGGVSIPKVTLGDTKILFSAPSGKSVFTASGQFDPDNGGDFDLAAAADALSFAPIEISGLSSKARLVFDPAGPAVLDGRVQATVEAVGVTIKDLAFAFKGEAAGWREALTGGGLGPVSVTATPKNFALAVNPDEAPTAFLRAAAEAGPMAVETGGAIALHASAAGPALSVSPDLVFRAPSSGAQLSLSKRNDAPILVVDGEGRSTLALSAAFLRETDGPGVRVEFDARQKATDAWALEVSAALDPQPFIGIALGATDVSIKGDTKGPSFDGVLAIASGVQEARLGRMAFTETDMSFNAPVSVSLDEKNAILGAACLKVARGAFAIAEQNMEGSLTDGALCAGEGPLARLDFADAPQLSAKGTLTAKRGVYRFGETRMRGAPPDIDFDLAYAPDAHRTDVTARYKGGAVGINETVVFSDADGVITAALDGPLLGADITLDAARISLAGEQPLANPVIGSARASLKNKDFTFSGAFKTLRGADLGRAEGVHSVETGRGSMTVNTDALAFAPDGLQPDQLTRLLRGVVFEATGEAEATFDLKWGRKRLSSSGVLTLRDISFRGPGLAVSKTSGVNGTVRFSNLAPITTDGEQTITVAGVDMDALQLADGTGRFSLPGDDTLRIVEGAFPWFGGTIGAYDTSTPLNGEKIVTRLQAANVNLSQLFEYLSIEGLSGEGVVEGVLPIVIEDGKARIEDGLLSAVGPGVLRYVGKAGDAAAQSGSEAALAFNVLRDLRYDLLEASINGPLDGSIDFAIRFEGASNVPLEGAADPVTTPVIYRMNIKAPFLELVRQGRVSTDITLQYQELRRALGEGAENEAENGTQ